MPFNVCIVIAMLIFIIVGIAFIAYILDCLKDIYERLEEVEKKLNEHK